MSIKRIISGLITVVLMGLGIYFLSAGLLLAKGDDQTEFGNVLLSSTEVPRRVMGAADRLYFWKVNTHMMAAIGGGLLIFSIFGFLALFADSFGFYIWVAVTYSFVGCAAICLGIMGHILHSDVSNNLGNVLTYQLDHSYTHEIANDTFSKGWNRVQVQMDCCGVKGYRDYRNTSFPTKYSRPVPVTCCKMTDKREMSPVDALKCIIDATKEISNSSYLNTRGCLIPYDQWALTWVTAQVTSAWVILGSLIIGIGVIGCLTPTSKYSSGGEGYFNLN